jgi:catechol 2,3-dioxygenase-like lactoylglutathione lyase family enzyme
VLTAFDHLVVAVRDLDAASEAYRRLGFDVRLGGRNPGRGTYNAIIRFGIDYIELLSVEDPELARDHAPSGQELLAYLDVRAGGAASWVAQSDDIAGDARRAAAAGFEGIGLPVAMRRARPDGTEFAWRLLIPRGKAFRRTWPLLIQWDTSDAARLAGEPAGRHDNGVLGVRSLRLVVPSVEEARRVYETQLGMPLAAAGMDGELRAAVLRGRIGDLEVSFLAPTGVGPIAQELAAHGPGPYDIGLAVRDMERTVAILRTRGVGIAEEVGGAVRVDPDEACGVGIRLEPASAAATP